jgi:two-component system response regulator MprA
MIVEDDTDVREVLSELLADEGFTTVGATNGREALDRLEAAKQGALPCVILLDMMMPEVDGWQFRAAQQSDPLLATIPVVVLSARADVRRAAETLKVAGYLTKPVDYAALLRIIRGFC